MHGKKVSSGESFRGRIKADDWNDMLDAAAAYRAQRINTFADGELYDQSHTQAQLYNDLGVDLPRGAIVGACDILHRPENDENEFKNEFIFCGRRPVAADTGRFFVVREPIIRDQAGEIAVAGIVAVKVRLEDNTSFAEMQPGNIDYLIPSPTGSARIIWRPDSNGVQWCYVRIGEQGLAQTNTSTTPRPQNSACVGRCKMVWHASGSYWEQVSNGCGTTTTTPAPTGQGSFGFSAWGQASWGFSPVGLSGGMLPTTTSTPRPSRCCNTTTTIPPGACQYCTYPDFCGASDGDCTFTFCSERPQPANPRLSCTTTSTSTTAGPTTTSSTTTTQAVNCNSCCQCGSAHSCTFTAVPVISGGALSFRWQNTSNPCCPDCTCPEPAEPPGICWETTQTACSDRPPEPPPCRPGCTGINLWLPAPGGGWVRQSTVFDADSVCSDGCGNPANADCYADPPSISSQACAGASTRCYQHGYVTITSSTTTTPDPCRTQCSTTTSSTTTSTTANPCQVNGCLYRATSDLEWELETNSCPPACANCFAPAAAPQETCETARTQCIPRVTTTSTTTTSTTTSSTTTSSTTTTLAPDWRCVLDLADSSDSDDCSTPLAHCVNVNAPGYVAGDHVTCGGGSYPTYYQCYAQCPLPTTTTPMPWYCISSLNDCDNPASKMCLQFSEFPGEPYCDGPYSTQSGCSASCMTTTTTPSP